MELKPTIFSEELITVLKGVHKALQEGASQPAAEIPQPEQSVPVPPQKPTMVIFDKSTGKPWQALFTERGFEIEDTRLSFEELETAISKEYTITLKNGQGMVLDAVKMQKILKRKDELAAKRQQVK